LLLAVVAVVAAIWLSLFLVAAKQQTLDQRVQEVGGQLKCPICQGESVADSPSLLAQQMRSVIRQQLQAGKSEQEVIQFFVSRYGEQIVWSPPWQGFTLLAWLVPIVLLLGGVVLLFFTLRDWHALAPDTTVANTTQSEEDRALSNIDEAELERYRTQLEQELAADDALFERYRTEA
jgi:cytochrome c-type biogenesis protein CcmH